MKIAIVGSMSFAKDILEVKKELEKNGHNVSIPPDTYDCVNRPDLSDNLDFVLKHDLLKKCLRRVEENDAVLVLNHEKNNIKGYIGGASLMEIGVAYHLNKKIYILNSLPDESELKYICEIKQAKPIILSGDLNKIE